MMKLQGAGAAALITCATMAVSISLPAAAWAATPVSAGAGQAYPPPMNGPVVGHIKPYTATWTFKDGELRRCVTYTVTGSIKYDTQMLGSGDVVWTNQRLSPQPALEASVHADNGGRCGGTATLYAMRMGQHWSGYSCYFNPPMSFPAFWVGVSFWPGCGKKRQVGYAAGYGSSSSYAQYTSGVPPVTFGNYWGLPGRDVCYGLYVSSQIYVSGRVSGTYQSSVDRLCLPT